jgi:hypothetical protein
LPNVVSDPAISNTSVTLTDGVWYFHLQGKDSTGWGKTSSYRMQIDTAGINPPTFDHFPAKLSEGDVLLVSGKTYPDSTVDVFLTDSSGDVHDQTTQSASDGRFELVWTRHLVHDIYELNGTVTNAHGITSKHSPDIAITVQAPIYERVGQPLLNYAALFLIAITLLALMIAWVWYLLHRISRFQKRVRGKVKKADQRIHTKFRKLQDMVVEQVQVLEKEKMHRRLTPQEEKIIAGMAKYFDEIEKDVEDDVDEIGK